MKVFLTFTGFHDPFAGASIDGGDEAGPVLTVVGEVGFDAVFLFSTPSTNEVSERTRDELGKRFPNTAVSMVSVPVKDPTNYLEILKHLRKHYAMIAAKHDGAEFYISVSSGTPQMHACWMMLAASGEIPAKVLQSRAAKFTPAGKSRVWETDFSDPAFPTVKAFKNLAALDEFAGLDDATRESLGIVGDNHAFLRALEKAQLLAEYDSHVLLLGETGVGKEVFADAIHHWSNRRGKPFIPINCAGLAEHLIESQLFGHKKGAFTGANELHIGCFEAANGGTLFLDEIGELPLKLQSNLLRALGEGKIVRLGTTKEIKVDVRVIAATNTDIDDAVKRRAFRKDLSHRFDDRINIPALRERRSDIPRLAQHFLDEWNSKHRKQLRLSADAIRRLSGHSWPGNIRQLRKVIESSARLCKGSIIKPSALEFYGDSGDESILELPEPHEGFSLADYQAEVRARLIEMALEKSNGNKSQAGRLLGMTPQAISQEVKRKS